MIPAAFITEWRAGAPWPESYQVEQDLILSRLMVEIAGNELLGGELVMRGGTCLHKLHLPRPYRYSEDLDYVRRTTGPIGPYLDQLREIAEHIVDGHWREGRYAVARAADAGLSGGGAGQARNLEFESLLARKKRLCPWPSVRPSR